MFFGGLALMEKSAFSRFSVPLLLLSILLTLANDQGIPFFLLTPLFASFYARAQLMRCAAFATCAWTEFFLVEVCRVLWANIRAKPTGK